MKNQLFFLQQSIIQLRTQVRELNINQFKGTIHVILSVMSGRFTTVPFKPFSDQGWCRYIFFSSIIIENLREQCVPSLPSSLQHVEQCTLKFVGIQFSARQIQIFSDLKGTVGIWTSHCLNGEGHLKYRLQYLYVCTHLYLILIYNYQEHVNSMVPGSASGVVSVPGGMNPETARIKTDLGKCVFSWFRI